MKSAAILVAVMFALAACSAPPSPGKETCSGNICVSHKSVACRAKVAIWQFEIYRKDNDTLQPEQGWSYVRNLSTKDGGPPEETVKHGFGPGKLPETLKLEQGKQTVAFGTPPNMIPYDLDWDVTCGKINPLTSTR